MLSMSSSLQVSKFQDTVKSMIRDKGAYSGFKGKQKQSLQPHLHRISKDSGTLQVS